MRTKRLNAPVAHVPGEHASSVGQEGDGFSKEFFPIERDEGVDDLQLPSAQCDQAGAEFPASRCPPGPCQNHMRVGDGEYGVEILLDIERVLSGREPAVA